MEIKKIEDMNAETLSKATNAELIDTMMIMKEIIENMKKMLDNSDEIIKKQKEIISMQGGMIERQKVLIDGIKKTIHK